MGSRGEIKEMKDEIELKRKWEMGSIGIGKESKVEIELKRK